MRRCLPPLLGSLLFLAFAVLHRRALRADQVISALPDGFARRHPFEDLRAILQAGHCWRRGVNVYAPSACMHGGVFNYAPFLLRAAYLPVGPADTVAGGVILALIFFAGVAALPPPRDRAGLNVRLLAVLSPSSFYALEQGNLDAGIFGLAVLAVWLCARTRPIAGYVLFALAAAAKFYPAAFFILLLREPAKRFVWVAGALLVIALLLVIGAAHDVSTSIAILPSSTPFRATFGEIDLFRGLQDWGTLPPATLRHVPATAETLGGAVVVLLAAAWAQPRYEQRLGAIPRNEAIFLVAGAAVITLCFFAAQNVYYRAIFLLLLLPGLGRRAEPWARRLQVVIVLLLWEAVPRDLADALAHHLPRRAGADLVGAVWLARELLWWWLVIQLAAITLAFTIPQAARLRAALFRKPRKIDGAKARA